MAQHGSRPAFRDRIRPQMSVTFSHADYLVKTTCPVSQAGVPPAPRAPGRRRVYPPAEGPPQKAPPPEASLGAPPSVPCTSAAPAHNDPPPNGEASDCHVR